MAKEIAIKGKDSLANFVEQSPMKITAISHYGTTKALKQTKKVASEISKDQLQSISKMMALKKHNKHIRKTNRDLASSTTNQTLDIGTHSTSTTTATATATLPMQPFLPDTHFTLPNPSGLITEQSSWYQLYPTTLGLIILIHIIFAYQRNRRKTKQQLLVSYRILIKRKQYHRGVVAILSHPPTTDNEAVSRQSFRTFMNIGHTNNGTSMILPQCHQRLQTLLHLLLHGHLSGLPLLLYNSHILWSCRSLEVQSSNYLLELLGLATVALGLELQILHSLQPFMERTSRRSQSFLLNRSIGSLTGLSAALLIRYHYPLLAPFSLSHFLIHWNGTILYLGAVLVLTMTSFKIHPFTSVICGTISGVAWNIKLTSWLGQPYWGTWLVGWIAVASILAMKASLSSLCAIRFLVDYVSWDHHGHLEHDQEEVEEASHDFLLEPAPIQGQLSVMELDEEDPWIVDADGFARQRQSNNDNHRMR